MATPDTVTLTSPAKARYAIAQVLENLPRLQADVGGMEGVMLATMAGFAPQLAGIALERVPEDPAELDAMLDKLAAWVLSMKSDPAAVGELEAGQP
jgi:hypothetical protein